MYLDSCKFHNIDIAESRRTGNQDSEPRHYKAKSGSCWLQDGWDYADILQAVTSHLELQPCAVWNEV